MTQGKVYEGSKFQKFASNKIGCSLNLKIHKFLFNKITELFWFWFTMYILKENIEIEIEDGRKAP